MTESRALNHWVALTGATQRRDWDAAMACLAPDCEWTLVPTGLHLKGTEAIRSFMQAGMAAGDRAPPEIKSAFGTDVAGVFEYVSRGLATAKATEFTKSLAAQPANSSGVAAAGDRYEFHVCFLFRLNEAGLISQVREYFAAPPPAG